MLLPLITGKPFCPEKVERAIEELNVVLKQFEEKFLEDKPFIAGSEISLADLVAVVEIMQVSSSSWVTEPGQEEGKDEGVPTKSQREVCTSLMGVGWESWVLTTQH